MTKLTADAEAGLAAIPYLRGLPPAELRRLAGVCRVRRLAKGAQAFAEGEPAAGLFVVLSGRMKLVRRSASGREQTLHREGPGATLGEVSVFDGLGYVASAIAAADAALLFVPRAPLLAALERHPASATLVIGILALRVRRFAALAEGLSLRGVAGRLAAYLLAEVERAGESSFVLSETGEELAAEIGTVREQVSRALSRLARQGVIRRQGRRVTVVDAGRLRSLAV